MKLISLFSRTGSEILNISRKRNRWPDAIITNKQTLEDVNGELLSNAYHSIIVIPDKPCINDYLTAFESIGAPDELFITLHGYLRIIPKEICDQYTMYNLHPGDIVNYEILKGKDPVQRITEDMTTIGCVLHRVSAELDSGEIIMHKTHNNMLRIPKGPYSDDVVRTVVNELILRQMAEDMWVDFLNNNKI